MFILLMAVFISLVFALQVLFATYLSIYGVAPSFLLLALMVFSLRYGSRYGAVAGFFIGIALDVFTLRLFGYEALVFTTLGFFCGLLNKRLDEALPKVRYIVSFSMCLVYYFAAPIALGMATTGMPSLNPVNAAGSLFYTVLLTRPMYAVFDYFALRIEVWSGKASQV
jgi:rod shape-determining protein MreD